MPKKLAVLLGSPRKDGNSERLAAALSKGASEAGYSVETIRLYGMKLTGCIDCRRCWTSGSHCFLKDDMQEVYAALDDADVIAFATPLYFYSWSTYIKPAWDRLVTYYMPNSKVDMKGRRAVLLATAADTDDECFDGLKKSFQLACNFCQWNVASEICAGGIQGAGEIAEKGREWLMRAEELGKSL